MSWKEICATALGGLADEFRLRAGVPDFLNLIGAGAILWAASDLNRADSFLARVVLAMPAEERIRWAGTVFLMYLAGLVTLFGSGLGVGIRGSIRARRRATP